MKGKYTLNATTGTWDMQKVTGNMPKRQSLYFLKGQPYIKLVPNINTPMLIKLWLKIITIGSPLATSCFIKCPH